MNQPTATQVPPGWTDEEKAAFFRNTDLSEPGLRLVAFNWMGVGATLADKRNVWQFHPITVDLLRDSRVVRAAVRRAWLIASFREEMTRDDYVGQVGEALDELAIILIRANYSLDEDRVRGLMPVDANSRDNVRRHMADLIQRVDRRAKRDGGLIDHSAEPVPLPSWASGPARALIPWPPDADVDADRVNPGDIPC